MMNYCVTGEQLTSIADAIRAKTGGSEELEFPGEFVSGIGSIMTLEDHGLSVENAALACSYSSSIIIPSGSQVTKTFKTGSIILNRIYTYNNYIVVQCPSSVEISGMSNFTVDYDNRCINVDVTITNLSQESSTYIEGYQIALAVVCNLFKKAS